MCMTFIPGLGFFLYERWEGRGASRKLVSPTDFDYRRFADVMSEIPSDIKADAGRCTIVEEPLRRQLYRSQ